MTDGPPNAHVVLVEPEIHWNTGNAGRSCLAFGARLHLVEPLGFSLDERQVRRAGLDYWPAVNPRVWPSWEAFEAALSDLGPPLVFTTDGQRTLAEVEIPDEPVLIFGRESTGLPEEVRRRYAEATVRIPMARSPVRSLNLSTAVALGLYEVTRRRRLATDD